MILTNFLNYFYFGLFAKSHYVPYAFRGWMFNLINYWVILRSGLPL
jgi:hypothetical protein